MLKHFKEFSAFAVSLKITPMSSCFRSNVSLWPNLLGRNLIKTKEGIPYFRCLAPKTDHPNPLVRNLVKAKEEIPYCHCQAPKTYHSFTNLSDMGKTGIACNNNRGGRISRTLSTLRMSIPFLIHLRCRDQRFPFHCAHLNSIKDLQCKLGTLYRTCGSCRGSFVPVRIADWWL